MRIVVISASSGIGSALCRHWRGQGHGVFGSYRTASNTADVRLAFLDRDELLADGINKPLDSIRES